MTRQALGIALEEARHVIRAGIQKAEEIGQPMNIAVVDAGTNLIAFERMDGAWLGSIDIAINKAFTARAFDIQTKALAENSQSGEQFFGIHVSNHGRVMIFAGGIPLKIGEQVVGAVGVSGGVGKQDQAVAEAAAGAFEQLTKKQAA
ncbi:MAG TPA: heme-binding protein [Terracidiphilus sp.]